MSINVTVNGNPISIRRGKMILSDLENIRKTERDKRRRLRLEQVKEQSKAVSKKILERARCIQQEELERLQQCENAEMRRAHNEKIMELHHRYQDIENIGYAHENAARQPDIQNIKQVEEQKNKAVAKARGIEAAKHLQESKNAVNSRSKQQKRLQDVRNVENQRSQMVAQLPKKSMIGNKDTKSSSRNDDLRPTSCSKKKIKSAVSKKSPVENVPKQAKVISTQTSRTPQVNVSVNDHNVDSTQATTTTCTNRSKTSCPNKLSRFSKTVSDTVPDTVPDISRINVCESDDNEPRRTVPVTSTSSKPEDLRYNASNYQGSSSDLSSTSSKSSSSISEDSSYFSDNPSKSTVVRKTPRHHTSPVAHKVNLYDHKTRQRNAYERPSGLVERINIKNKPNAEDLAQEIMELESQQASALENQKESLRQRSEDAVLREKIRRDYQLLLKTMEQLNEKERKLRAVQISTSGGRVQPPCKRSEDLAKKQKQMDRVFQGILRSSQIPASSSERIERPITITPRDYIHSQTTSNAAWNEPPSVERQSNVDSCSEDEILHRREISELLLKIESLKRRLLQELGADLPDDIFNASVKSLFGQTSSPTSQENIQHSATKSEIQVINMSSDEAPKSVHQVYKPSKTRTATFGKALSKSTVKKNMTTRDQQVQVELDQDKSKEAASYPLEPVVEIVTPENGDSCNSYRSNSSVATDVVIDVGKDEITVVPKGAEKSKKKTQHESSAKSRHSTTKTPVKISFEKKDGRGSFEVAGFLIDPEKREITVLPKRKKTSSKRESQLASDNCKSLPESRVNSPSKKFSRSAPSSRQTSPKKSESRQSKSLDARDGNCEERRYKTQYTQVSIDSSTESSQLNSTSDSTNGTFYTRFHSLASKRIITKIHETSDTSTTYASPPTATAGNLLNAMNSSTPILELLDSSPNERFRQKARLVSPVSSPETPSPRTMKLPSNKLRATRVSKNIKFMSLINTQTRPDSSSNSRSTHTSLSITRDRSTTTRPSTRSCTCKNPGCKLVHDKIEDTQAYALKHFPETLKKYEDLQNVCTDRIASLTDLIQKVRNEQKGLELSMVTHEDSSSAGRASNEQSSANGNVNELVKSMEAVHAQLKKTLMDSQKLISGGSIDLQNPAILYSNADKSYSFKGSTSGENVEDETGKAKSIAPSAPTSSVAGGKPKIVNAERVSIKLDRYRSAQPSKTTEKSKTTETTEEATSSAPDQSEELVERLSKEILEQSKSINKLIPVNSLKDSDNSILKSSQADVKDMVEIANNDVVNDKNNQSANLDISTSDFIPLLADIPKVIRTMNNSVNGTRTKPPVTLISRPFRPEITSQVHELSTIVEFDTPDTVNKSQISTKNPSNKCRKKLLASETIQSAKTSPSKKNDMNLIKSKPSVHVAPLPPHQSPQLDLNSSNKSAIKSSPKKSANKSTESLEKMRSSMIEEKKICSSDSMHTLPDVLIEQLHQSHENTDGNYDLRISQISELHSLPEESVDQILLNESHRDKSKSLTPAHKQSISERDHGQKQEQDKSNLMSSRSTSFSGLSGVSEITTSPSSDINPFKCPSSPEEMEEALKKWGLGWAIPTLKKTREASALGSSSSSDVTPVNTNPRLVSPVKKPLQQQQQQQSQQHLESTPGHELPEVSDVSSISIKHANKSTERSVLVKGRTSTPNRLNNSNDNSNNNSNHNSNNSDGTVSTLGSFSSDLNIVLQNQSADITIPNISFSNNKFD